MLEDLYATDDRERVFTLASSGEVRLYGLELDVIDTPEFQRLGGIKQLGTSSVVFRSAVHTRFEHSLGTLAMAEVIFRAAENSMSEYKPEEIREARQLARLGGLLHDLPHLPFGHTLEDEFGLLPRHDKDPVRWKRLLTDGELGDVLSSGLGADTYAELCKLLEAKSEHDIAALRYPFVADIVGNTVCADLLDYIVRDLEACGMPVALGRRFLSYFVVTKKKSGLDGDVDSRRMALRLEKRGMPRPDVESEVVKLLSYRYELAERVYFHHAKNAASVMIGRAVQDLGLVGDLTVEHEPDERALPFLFLKDGTALSDDLLSHCLANPEVATALGLPVTEDHATRERSADLGRALLRRDLYKLAYLGVYDDLEHRLNFIKDEYGDPSSRVALEDRLAAEIGLTAGDVLIHLPAPKMMVKAAEVRVERSDGTITTLEGWDRSHSHRVDSLNEAHRRLWRVMVFVKPESDRLATDKRRRLVAAGAADVFGAPSRYLPATPTPPPAGWSESEDIRNLSHLHQEVALEIALAHGYPTDLMVGAIPTATQHVKTYGDAPTVEEIRAAWTVALPDLVAPAETEPAQISMTEEFGGKA